MHLADDVEIELEQKVRVSSIDIRLNASVPSTPRYLDLSGPLNPSRMTCLTGDSAKSTMNQ